MFRSSDKVTIIIDGVSLEVPDKILTILPTTSGMQDTRVYETGLEVTYESLEPLIADLVLGTDAYVSKWLDEHPEDWDYYLTFLNKYVDPDVVSRIFERRRQRAVDLMNGVMDVRNTKEYLEYICKIFKPYNDNRSIGLSDKSLMYGNDIWYIPDKYHMFTKLIETFILHMTGKHPLDTYPGVVLPLKVEMEIFGLSL